MSDITYKSFWFVWNPDGRAPTVRHQSLVSAVNEAERLAHLYPEQTFVVLQSVCARRVSHMMRINLEPDAEIPF